MLTVRAGAMGLAVILACGAVTAADAPPPRARVAWRAAWSQPVPSAGGATELQTPDAAVSREALVLAAPHGTVTVLDPRTGRLRRTIPADPRFPQPVSGVWTASGTLVVARGSAHVPAHLLYAYDLATGTLLWRRPLELIMPPPDHAFRGPRIMAAGHAVVVVERPTEPVGVRAFDLRSGAITAQAALPGGCRLEATATTHRLLLISQCAAGRNTLSGLDPRTLRHRWTRPLPSGDLLASFAASAGQVAHAVAGPQDVFIDEDGRPLPASDPGRWNVPLHLGSYPARGENGEIDLSGGWPLPAYLLSPDPGSGRLTGLPLDVPAGYHSLIGATDGMAFVRDHGSDPQRVIAYRQLLGHAAVTAELGGVEPEAWPDACALLSEHDLRILGDRYRPVPTAKAIGATRLPKPAACDWIPAADDGAVVSLTLDWVSPSTAAARRMFAAEVTRVKDHRHSPFDPTTESAQLLAFTASTPAGTPATTLVRAGPVIARLTSSSRQALRLIAPRLRDTLRARYREPLAPVPPRPPGWSRLTEAGSPIELAVVRDVVYAAAGERLYALDAATGTARWSVRTGSDALAAPVPAGDTVYAALDDGRVVALEARSGRRRWSRAAGARGRLTVAGRRVYVRGGDFAIIALDAATGTTRWRFRAAGPILNDDPIVAGGVVYSGSDHATVYALDARSGRPRWRLRLPGERGRVPLAVAAGVVYATSRSGAVHALDAATGTTRWRTRLGPLAFEPVVAAGTVYLGGAGRQTYALNASTGRERWTFRTPGDDITNAWRVTPARDLVYLGGTDGRLHAVDTATGQERWSGVADVDAGITLAGGTAYVGGGDGVLSAFDAVTGAVRWRVRTGGGIDRAPITSGGLVYAGSANGILYALPMSGGAARACGPPRLGPCGSTPLGPSTEPARPVLDGSPVPVRAASIVDRAAAGSSGGRRVDRAAAGSSGGRRVAAWR